MKVKKFQDYRRINEEFNFGSAIKGALSKLFNLFAAPFKDLANDIKKLFKVSDLGTVKDILLANLNQAIDAAQKEIPNIKESSSLTDLLPKMLDQLANLGTNIDKEVISALGKDKGVPFAKAAKAVILGSKSANFAGIVGIIDPGNEIAKKYNGGVVSSTKFENTRSKYEKLLSNLDDTNKKKTDQEKLKIKKPFAIKYFDALQKEMSTYIEKELTDEELIDIYNSAGGEATDAQSGEELLKSYGVTKKEELVGKEVRYKTKAFDDKKKPEEQKDNIGKLKVLKVTPDGLFFDGEKEDFEKKMNDILPAEDAGENAKKVGEILGKIKTDEEKMDKIRKFSEFIQDDTNKDKVVKAWPEILKLMSGPQGTEEQ
jgi:hypothetical protein